MLDKGEREEAERILAELLGGDQDDLQPLIDILTSSIRSSGKTRAKAADRTRDYKIRQILRGPPGSEDVMTAIGYATLGGMSQNRAAADAATAQVYAILEEAGFDREQSQQVLVRLQRNVVDRKNSWIRRLTQRRARRLARLCQEIEAQDRHTG